jgi:hypothetical protein
MTTPTTEQEEPQVEGSDTMIFLTGRDRSFRCDCGGNVFRRFVDNAKRFKCNSCAATYTGD